MVWHEFFSAASRVGVVARMEGWKGAECAILGTEIGGVGRAEVMVAFVIANGFLVDDIMRSNYLMESQLSARGKGILAKGYLYNRRLDRRPVHRRPFRPPV